MEASSPARVLVVANRTAATPKLLEAVRQRAARGPCTFTLLVPALADVVDPDNVVVERTLALRRPRVAGRRSADVPVRAGAVARPGQLRAGDRSRSRDRRAPRRRAGLLRDRHELGAARSRGRAGAAAAQPRRRPPRPAERHSTMRKAIAWSYDLLTKPEQRLFTRLAVFIGTFETGRGGTDLRLRSRHAPVTHRQEPRAPRRERTILPAGDHPRIRARAVRAQRRAERDPRPPRTLVLRARRRRRRSPRERTDALIRLRQDAPRSVLRSPRHSTMTSRRDSRWPIPFSCRGWEPAATGNSGAGTSARSKIPTRYRRRTEPKALTGLGFTLVHAEKLRPSPRGTE